MATPRTSAKKPAAKTSKRDAKPADGLVSAADAVAVSSAGKMKIPELLAELEETAKQLDVKVTYEAMTGELGSGGLCKVKGQWRVIIDKRATPGDRVSILALALTRVPREGVTLHPSVEKLLSEVKPRTVSMEDALDSDTPTA